MNKTRTLCTSIVFVYCAFTTAISGQSLFYYGPHGKTYFQVSKEKVFVRFSKTLPDNDRQKIAAQFQSESTLRNAKVPSEQSFTKLNSSLARLESAQIIARIQSQPGIEWVSPVLVSDEGGEIAIGSKVCVKLKSPADYLTLQLYATQYEVEKINQDQFYTLMYTLEFAQKTATEILDMANQLSETKLFDWAEPVFHMNAMLHNSDDPYYPIQWHLNNTGFNNSKLIKGKADADIDAPEAWVITRGSPNIKIAIFDTGVELNHPDLQANLLPGYDATGRGSAGGAEGDGGNAHGTECAGVVAAVGNNKIGGTGIAPNCKIIPIRLSRAEGNSLIDFDDLKIANAIFWAWNNAKADILSNSWGGGTLSNKIEDAIDLAVEKGRDGKGCIVLFSSGNSNTKVSSAAAYSKTIAVGASSMCDERKRSSNNPAELNEGVERDPLGVSCDNEKWWGSNYGANLDIAAPSPLIVTTTLKGAYSVDFNGTSAACPVAAGVMALILSANPNLSGQDARFILESTCDKVGGYSYTQNISQPNGTWCADLGYGRVNAYQAVLKARTFVSQQNDYGMTLNAALEASPNPSNIGAPVTVQFNVKNTGKVEFSGEIAAALFSDAGDFVDFMGRVTIPSLPVNYTFTNNLTFVYQNAKPKGRFHIGVFFLPKGSPQWILIGEGKYDNYITWLNGYALSSNCSTPSLIKISSVGYSHFKMSWQEVAGVKNYEIRYRRQGAGDWVELPNWTGTTHVSFNKTPCTTYEWQIRSGCSSSVGDWSPVQIIKTEGCEDPYCYTYGASNRSYIKQVQIGDIAVSSGADYGYTNNTATSINTTPGNPLAVKLTPGKSTAESLQEVYWQIWIDYNADQKFDELVFERKGDNESAVSGSINIPSNASGTTRLRVMMSQTPGTSPCDREAEKEVEDYSINLGEGRCVPPENVRLSEKNYSWYFVQWDTLPGVQQYSWRIKKAQDANWSTKDDWNNSSIINPIGTPCTEYVIQVRSVCGNTFSDWSPELRFTTDGCDDPYCYSYGLSVYDWIKKITVAGTNIESGIDIGYINRTSTLAPIQLEAGKSFPLGLSAGFDENSETSAYYWQVWIDYNQDNDFSDAGELAYAQSASKAVAATGIQGSINTPSNAKAGQTRMRVALSGKPGESSCETSLNYREVEDLPVAFKSPSTSLVFSPSTLNFEATGGNKSISITSNTSWSLTETLPWLSVTPASGSNNGNATVSCQTNSSTIPRSGTIAIKGTNIAEQKITITQAGISPSLSVTPPQLSYPSSGSKQSLTISSNGAWTISNDSDWLNIATSSGTGDANIAVTAAPNSEPSIRTAQISLKNADGSITRSIEVEQAANLSLALPESWTFAITENNHTLILPSNMLTDINGSPLQIGDHIGVFYSSENKLWCAGEGEWNGSNTSFPIYGDDSSTPIKDGFSAGETFKIKVWQANNQLEFDVQATYAPVGTNGIISATDRYLTDGISMITRLNYTQSETQNIALKEGWNTISSYIVPSNPQMDSVLRSIKNAVQIAKDGTGKTYLISPPINSIGNWKPTEGYRIKVNSAVNLAVTGKPVDPVQTAIPIRSGWQIIPFYSRSSKSIELALASIADNIDIVKDNAGKVYIPGVSINTIGQMQTAQGYRLKAKTGGELRYPAEFLGFATSTVVEKTRILGTDTLQHFRISKNLNTGSNATLVFIGSAVESWLKPGDEIGVFAADTILCGAGKYDGTNLAITVWGDDATEQGRQGLFPGEKYQLRVWQKADNQEIKTTADFGSNKGTYQEDDIVIVQALHPVLTSSWQTQLPPQAFGLAPNPSSGILQLRSYQSLGGTVDIQILSLSGQVLQQHKLSNGLFANQSITFDLSNYPSGMYYVQVLSGKGRWTGKLSLIMK